MSTRIYLLILLSGLLLIPAGLSCAGESSAAAPGTPTQQQATATLPSETPGAAVETPGAASSVNTYVTDADPVTGRNKQIDLSWQELGPSTWYELQIARDREFTERINPAVNYSAGGSGAISSGTGSILLNMDEVNMSNPAAWLPPGILEAGATYYWRIRAVKSATGQWADSPWSEPHSFTVKPWPAVNTPYPALQLINPLNGCSGCKVSHAAFTWSPWQDANKYEFVLSKDPEFKQVVVTAATTTTAYEYNGTLEYSTNYFWRVRVLEINGKSIPSDWSATFSYQTEAAPLAPLATPAAQETPLWVWVVIGIGTILVIVTVVLAIRARK